MLRLTSIGSDDDEDTDGGGGPTGNAEKGGGAAGGRERDGGMSASENRRVHMTWTKEKALQYRATHSGCSTPEGFRDMLSIRP